VVEVRFHAQGQHSFLRVDIDRAGPRGVDLGDCEAVSRILDRSLEESALLAERRYDLQVSSPGLDRPIRSEDDFRRNTGRRIVLTVQAGDGRSETIRGVLVGVSAEHVHLAPPGADSLRVERLRVVSAVQDPEPEAVRPPSTGGPISRRRRGIV
jgi:ribosome maturation factor RimP